MTWIQTRFGRAFQFEDFADYEFDPEEVAIALSRTPRFSGHTKWFYSVAQHCCLVSRMLHGFSPRDQLAGLLHDAHEAYVGDISKPLKWFLQSSKLQQLEHELLSWVNTIHSLDEWDMRWVARADLEALATEARDVMEETPIPWDELPEPWARRIEPWHPEFARDEWLRLYQELA